MPWFKVDDRLYSHPKALAAGTPAMGLWVLCGSWSSAQLQDGHVPLAVARMYGTAAMAKALVKSGLWREVAGGYQFHDWKDKNPLKEHVEAVREARRHSGQMGGKASGKARATGKENASSGASALLNTRPVPSRPVVGGSLRDGPQLEDAGEKEDRHELEDETAEQLCVVIHQLQPTWQIAKIRDVIVAARQMASSHRLTSALLIVAVAHDSQSPRRVLSPGYWWDEGDSRYSEALNSPKLAAVFEAVS